MHYILITLWTVNTYKNAFIIDKLFGEIIDTIYDVCIGRIFDLLWVLNMIQFWDWICLSPSHQGQQCVFSLSFMFCVNVIRVFIISHVFYMRINDRQSESSGRLCVLWFPGSESIRPAFTCLILLYIFIYLCSQASAHFFNTALNVNAYAHAIQYEFYVKRSHNSMRHDGPYGPL